jgi:hypothetical protein
MRPAPQQDAPFKPFELRLFPENGQDRQDQKRTERVLQLVNVHVNFLHIC